MLLICISVDRLYAFVYPMSFYDSDRRTRRMLIGAWVASVLLSLPQSAVVHLKTYAQVEGLVQCITYGSLQNRYVAAFINLKSIFALYVVPLAVIVYCYARILLVIHTVPAFIRSRQFRHFFKLFELQE